MSAPIPIKFKLTNAGRLAALDAFNSGLNLKLTEVAIGTAKYNSETTGATRTALQNEIGRYPLSGGSIEPVSRTLRFSAILESGITQNAFEVGLFDEHGVLFAVASTTSNDPLILVTANIAFVAAFSLVLTDVNGTNITVVDDPSSPLAIALMNQHVANADPHPQYPLKTALANAIWPVDSWHGTNSTSYNPATALAPFFGYETTWYLWPYVPAGVANTSAALGQFITLQNGNGTQAATTRIWQRLPDGASPPSYSLTASQTTVDEGEQITFTLNTTGLAQGTAVDWLILSIPYNGINASDISPSNMSGSFIVGADGSATHTITIVADEATEGTEILQFLLAAFPEKSVSITINDTSFLLERYVEYPTPDDYYIVVKPNETIEVVLLGGCGAGGGLFRDDNNPEDASTILNATGKPSMLFNFNGSPMATAESGASGQSGIWTNTGALTNGNGGSGGSTSIQSSVLEGEITLISRADGQSGKQTLADHTGGLAAVLTDRQGGEGMSYAIQTNPPLYGFGGGGAGGGYLKFKYKNTSSEATRTLHLIVGRGGNGWLLGDPPQQHESGTGSHGFASVHWNKP